MQTLKVIAEVFGAITLLDFCVIGLIYYNRRKRISHVHRPRCHR